jgi:hypothetical protein
MKMKIHAKKINGHFQSPRASTKKKKKLKNENLKSEKKKWKIEN